MHPIRTILRMTVTALLVKRLLVYSFNSFTPFELNSNGLATIANCRPHARIVSNIAVFD
jgi:hypothetical protein